MDRISHLPDSIAHHILSFLDTDDEPPTELVRMSVLSKTWFDLTASFPILYFNIDDFRSSRESFFKYVDYTTSRFCHQNVTAIRLELITTLLEPAELDVVNRCLELLLNKGVKELVIDFTESLTKCRLPKVLLSVATLGSLTIGSCELPSSLMVDDVMFRSLVHLELREVRLDEEAIKRLTASCPLLQVFWVINCHGFERFCVYGHQNLQKVLIGYNTRVERIHIEAPSLSCLLISDYDEIGAPPMNLALCEKLTRVTYFGNPLPNSNGFTNFLSNFPFVESLLLATTYKCKNLKLSSNSLKKLMLHPMCDFEEIEFCTPNLVSLSYPCDLSEVESMLTDAPWPLLRDSDHLKACMHCYPDGYIDTLWFQNLRRFLDKKNGFKVLNLHIHATYHQKYTELVKLKAIEFPPYELEHVEVQLEVHEDPLAQIPFLEAVLWCCRPRSLTLRSSFSITDFEEQSEFVKFTYEKLLEQEDQGHTSIKIVSPSSSFLKALSGEGKAISFIKEEVVQEEANSQRLAGLEIF